METLRNKLFANVRYFLIDSTNSEVKIKILFLNALGIWLRSLYKYFIPTFKAKQIRQQLNSSGAQEDKYLSSLITHVIGDTIDQLDYLEAREVFDLPIVKV